MAKIDELKVAVEKGKAKLVPGLVQAALDEGTAPVDALNAMIDSMGVVGENFKNGTIFVPEMLIAAKAMKKGVEVLKPLLHPAKPALRARSSSAPSLATCTTSARTWLL